VRSHLWGSWRQGAPGPRLRAAGTSGSYLIADADGQEAQLRSGTSPASAGQRWGAEPPERWGQLLRGDTAEPVPSARGPGTCSTPPSPPPSRHPTGAGRPWDAVATAAVLDAARTSARTGQVSTPGADRLTSGG